MDSKHEAAALRYFKKHDPALHAAALPHRGSLASWVAGRRRRHSLFAALAASVVGQQLSVRAADTIWKRLEVAAGGKVTPDKMLSLRTPTLRKAGLSASKARTLKELAKAVKGGLNLASLARVPEEEAIAKLTAVWGIGTWTAEMFLIFALGRLDVFSPGDLGLIRAMESLYDIPKDSARERYIEIAARWSPYRSVACLALWRHYESSKGTTSG